MKANAGEMKKIEQMLITCREGYTVDMSSGSGAASRFRKAGRGPAVLVCLLCAPNKYSLFYQQNKFPFWPLHMHK